MMSKEQKIEWLKNATNEEVVSMLRWAVTAILSENIATQVDGNESYELITEEILKRMK